MKQFIVALSLPLICSLAHAATYSGTTIVNQTLQDGTGTGLTSSQDVATSISTITNVTVSLNIDTTWSGDLYAYIQHSSGISILLNRTGRTSLIPEGSSSENVVATFEDAATQDAHFAASLLGYFQPSARLVDPGSTTDSSTRSAFLSAFNGMNANGGWTLYVEDTASGDTAVVREWTLNLQGTGTVTWDGGGANGNWSSQPSNWLYDAAPTAGDSLVFSGSSNTATTNDLAAGTEIAGITFSELAGAFTVSGNQIQLTSDVTNLSTVKQTLALPAELSNARRFITNGNGGNIDVSGVVSGTGSLTKDGAGTLRLTGTNTFTGTTTVSNGVLDVSGAQGSIASSSQIIVNGGTLMLSGSSSNRIGDAAQVTLGTNSTTTPAIQLSGSISEIAGPLSLLAGTTIIDFGTTDGVLTFSSLNGATGSKLTFWNYSGQAYTGGGTDRFIISDGPAQFSGLSLSDIEFYSGSGTGYLGFAGWSEGTGNELVPVPEPATLSVMFGLVGSIGWNHRRVRQRRALSIVERGEVS